MNGTSPLPRVILHLDMDAFYAAVEVRENPALIGKPLIIGHRGSRGVVSTCSYEARRFGVHSAMPSVTAERLCPGGVWLPGRMDLYQEISGRIRALMEAFTPLVEPLSIDEAFLDLTGIVTSLEDGAAVGRRLKQRIRDQERLTGSVGVARNKFLAKLASDLEKPDGLVVFPPEAVAGRLWALPVERLWGVGPRTAGHLHGLGLRKIGDLLEVPLSRLVSRLGANAAGHLTALARGIDERPVNPSREARSISEERTYARDLFDPKLIHRELLARAEGVSRELRDEGLQGWTVSIKVRTGDFTTWTRSITLPSPTHLAGEILGAARELFRDRIDLGGRGVRLLGVGISGLGTLAPPEQPGLFPDPDREREERSARVEDAVRRRFGDGAITRAGLLKPAGSGEPSTASSLPTVD